MLQRWLVAIIGLPVLLMILLLCPPWATALLMGVVAGAAAYELLRVAGKNVSRLVYGMTIVTAFLLVQQVCLTYTRLDEGQWSAPESVTLFFLPLLLTVALFLLAVITYGKPNALPFSTVSAGVVAGVVFPMMYSCIALLRIQEPMGRVYVLAPFAVAFAGDSLAMYFGMWFGKKKMSPLVSPKKTWAGFWGSLFGSGVGMTLLVLVGSRWFSEQLGGRLCYFALIGVTANLFGQLGDLSMSLVKREHDVKDYSRLFLTHGGVLDRFDSTLFIAPVIFYFVILGKL